MNWRRSGSIRGRDLSGSTAFRMKAFLEAMKRGAKNTGGHVMRLGH